jgi:hypothetical protein
MTTISPVAWLLAFLVANPHIAQLDLHHTYATMESTGEYAGLKHSIEKIAWDQELLKITCSLEYAGPDRWYLAPPVINCEFTDDNGKYIGQTFFYMETDGAFPKHVGERTQDTQNIFAPDGARSVTLRVGSTDLVTKPVSLPPSARK